MHSSALKYSFCICTELNTWDVFCRSVPFSLQGFLLQQKYFFKSISLKNKNKSPSHTTSFTHKHTCLSYILHMFMKFSQGLQGTECQKQLLSCCRDHTAGATSLFLPATGHKGHAPNFNHSQQQASQNNSNMQFLVVFSDCLDRHKSCYKDTEVATQTAVPTAFAEANTYQIIKEGKVGGSCTLHPAILFFKHF